MSTVVSIIESGRAGAAESHMMEVVELLREWAADPAFKQFLTHEQALNFFKDVPGRISAWVERIKYLRQMAPDYLETLIEAESRSFAFDAALARMAAQEAFVSHAARMAALNAAADAAEGTLVVGVGTTVVAVVVPVVAMIAVQVALGAPYYQAREQARKQGYNWGFAKGFITGLLHWELRFTIDRFWDDAVDKNPYDEQLPKIRANAHNQALIHGRTAGLAKQDTDKKNYLMGLRKLTQTSAGGWTPRSDDWVERARARNVQVSYVIALAGAALKHRVVDVG